MGLGLRFQAIIAFYDGLRLTLDKALGLHRA